MCDDTTLAEDRAYLSRRSFVQGGAGVTLAAGLPLGLGACATLPAGPRAVAEHAVAISTPDGTADGFFVHPADGTHAAVLMWPDIGGLREANRVLSRRLAGEGYAVLAVNHYYRSQPAPVLPAGLTFMQPEGRALLEPMGKRLGPASYASDALAFATWLDAQEGVDKRRKIGSIGYCMTGQATIRTAAAVPARIGAAASFHGGGLVTDRPDSPHLLIPQTRAAFLIAIAENDDQKESETKGVLRRAADAAGRPAEIEVYAGARHGWTMPDSAIYDRALAERAWERMLVLFETHL